MEKGLRLAGTEAIDGKCKGEGVGRPKRGAFGVSLAECAEKAQHLRLKFQKLLAPFPRRNLVNLANDGVVLLRKCREQKFAPVLIFGGCSLHILCISALRRCA